MVRVRVQRPIRGDDEAGEGVLGGGFDGEVLEVGEFVG